MTEYNNITVVLKEHYLMVCICREKCSNALDESTIKEIMDVLEQNEAGDIRAVIITGSGDKCFSAGADLHKLKKKTSLDILNSRLQSLCQYIQNYKFPIIAAVNGYAFGGGMELAISCDFIVASTNAVFGLPEVILGIIPSAGGTQRLGKLIGAARAKQVILLGHRISAKEAVSWGMVYKAVKQQDLLMCAGELAASLQKNSPYAVMLAKSCINTSLNTDNLNYNYEKMCQAVLVNQRDKEEGINAFFEKRLATFEKMK